MKSATLLQFLALVACTAGCNHHGDKEWTKEELDQLEAKWGYEVCSAIYRLHALGINCSSGGLKESGHLLIYTTSSALPNPWSHSISQSSERHLTQP